MITKTCGRDTSCAIVLEHSTVSDLHARIELADDGRVHLQDIESDGGTFLQRNHQWIRVRRVVLCIGDRIRFGEIEIPLEQLVTVFGPESGARLEAKHFTPGPGSGGLRSFAKQPLQGPVLQKPRRNPVTGKIEEDTPTRVR